MRISQHLEVCKVLYTQKYQFKNINYMKNSIKILLVFSVLLLTSCQNHYSLEDNSISEEGKLFIESYNLDFNKAMNCNVHKAIAESQKTRASVEKDLSTYEVVFPSDTDARVKDLLNEVETIEELYDLMYLTNAHLEQGLISVNGLQVEISEKELIKSLEPTIKAAKDYLYNLDFTESEIQKMLAENGVDESSLIPFVVALTDFEISKCSASYSPYLDCALDALDLNFTAFAATSSLKTWGKVAVEKAFKSIAKKMFGPLGWAIMAASYIKCMVTSNTTCTYATTSLSSPIVDKYNRITMERVLE